jgi:hypothetical protein
MVDATVFSNNLPLVSMKFMLSMAGKTLSAAYTFLGLLS